MRRVLPLFLLLPVAFAAAGCREVNQPFEADDQMADRSEPRRLTFSVGDDRSPAWSPGSDSVYYSASSSDFVVSEGALLSVALTGGPARSLIEAQLGLRQQHRLLEVAPAPAGHAIAFIELRLLRPDTVCASDSIACSTRFVETVRLDHAELHLIDSTGASSWTELRELVYSGVAQELGFLGDVTLFETRYTRHQVDWIADRALPSKPSWSADGRVLLTADGDGIHAVDATTGESSTIVTGDVANPAWSPDGERIAFDRVERVDSVTDLCLLRDLDRKGQWIPVCWEQRVFYETTPPVVVLAEPDGTGQLELAGGADPAWHPDGRSLFYVTAGGIVRHDLESGAVATVAGTEGGREPAVSPDGRWLAFTRYDAETEGHDVWVVRLE